MGKVIRFPSNSPRVLELESVTDEVEQVLRGVLGAIRHDVIKPVKLFVAFTEGDVVSYLNVNYEPDELVKAVDLVLQDIAKGYDQD